MSGSKENEEQLLRGVERDLVLGSGIGGAGCVVVPDGPTGGRVGASAGCVVTLVGGT